MTVFKKNVQSDTGTYGPASRGIDLERHLKNFSANKVSVRAKKGVSNLFPVLLLAISLVPACYSSTAIKGTPVKELIMAKDRRIVKEKVGEEKKQKIKEMSRVTKNRVFMVVGGIPEYRVGAGDILEIKSHIGEKFVSTEVTVNSRGKFSYSFVDDLHVAGLTPSQIDGLLTRSLSNFVRNPRIDILVKAFNSKSAMVLGELSNLRAQTVGKAASGKINLQGKTTLLDLLSLAGGYTTDADIKSVKLIRAGETYFVNVFDIIEKGDRSKNVIIDDEDVVEVPELPVFGERVYVLGEVHKQGIYPLKDAQDLLGALSLAGSFTKLAREENTLIVRGYKEGEKPLVMMADVDALLRKADILQNVQLQHGDLVYVPRMLIGDINDWIANTTPLLEFLFYPNKYESAYFSEDKRIFLID